MDIFVVEPCVSQPQPKAVVGVVARASGKTTEQWVQRAAEMWPDTIYFFVELVSPEL